MNYSFPLNLFLISKIYINIELKERKDTTHLAHISPYNFLVLRVLSMDIKFKSLRFLNFKLLWIGELICKSDVSRMDQRSKRHGSVSKAEKIHFGECKNFLCLA